MIVKQKSFSDALRRVLPLTSGRSTLPVLSNVCLEAKLGLLMINATNLDAYAVSCCECEGDLEPTLVRASAISALAQQPCERIEMNLLPNTRLQIKATGIAALATYQPLTDMPPFPSGTTPIGLSTVELADSLDQVVWAADATCKDRPILQGVGVWTNPTSIVCAGTTGRCIGYVNKPTICATSKFVIPANSVSMFTDALRFEGCDFSVSDKFVIATSANYNVAVRLLEGVYYDVTAAFNKDVIVLGDLEVSALISVLETIRLLCDPQDDRLALKFSASGLEVSYVSGMNDFTNTVAGTFADCEVLIGANLAHRALKSCTSPVVKVSRSNNVLVFGCGDYDAVISLRYKTEKIEASK